MSFCYSDAKGILLFGHLLSFDRDAESAERKACRDVWWYAPTNFIKIEVYQR
jgi:hypothetical protein